MKNKSLLHGLSRGMRTSFTLAAALTLFAAVPAARGASAAELLEKGIYTEETKGELKAASQIYQQIVDDPAATRSLVAQAQLRLGLCELKLGNKPQAISALERLTQEFPDKDALLAVVGQQVPQLLDEMVKQIEQNYIQEVDRSELMETAIRAIVGKLDARGGFLRTNDMEFLGTNELAQVNQDIEQKFAGIGAVLKTNVGEIVVQTPLPGSPALAGGLRAGDRIVTVDGTSLPETKPLETAVKLLRGPVGTAVTVGVKRDGSEELHEIKLVRNTIPVPSVFGDHRKPDYKQEFMLVEQRKIGYLRLAQIGKQSTEELRAALDELTARGMKALILDLRNNPGGILEGAVAAADLFLESGRIVTVKGREGETVYDAKAESTFTGFPVAVLVNQKTASAAEIIAASLQDHGRAVVVGERTFGQGIVKSLFELKSGFGAVKLPVAAYYRASGKSMNRFPDAKDSEDWGVTPNDGFEVALTDDESKQLEKERAARDGLSGAATPEVALPDRQLQKALDAVLAQLGKQ